MDPSHFFTPLTPLGARNQGLETKNFEIPHCIVHTWLDKTAAKLHRLLKLSILFLLIVSKKDRACGFLKVFNKSLDSDFLLLCFSSRTKVA